MLTKKLVKLFAKTFAKSVSLPDTTITYHKGGVVELTREGITNYYHFTKTKNELVVLVRWDVGDDPELNHRVLLRLPKQLLSDIADRLKVGNCVAKHLMRLLADAIVTDFFSPTPVLFGRYTGRDKLYCEADGEVMSAVAETISRRVGMLSKFNVELNGLSHYHISIDNKPFAYPYNNLTLYQQGDCIVVTVCKVNEDFYKLDFTYTLCKSYCTKSIAELTELVEDVIKAHDSFKDIND